MADRDMIGLEAILRRPARPELRAQAAWALGELNDVVATENLVRAQFEDPDPAVQAAARQALNALLGSNAGLAIASYQRIPPPDDWLTEAGDSGDSLDDLPEELGEADLTGLIMIARHESHLPLRLKAVRVLAHSSDMRATETLAELALKSDDSHLRAAANQALTDRYGEDAGAIIESYRDEVGEDDEDDLLDEEDESDEGPLSDELEDEDEWDNETEAELGEDQEGQEEEDQDEIKEEFGGYYKGRVTRAPSPFQTTPNQEPDPPVLEEIGIPWQTIFWILLIIAILAGILILWRP